MKVELIDYTGAGFPDPEDYAAKLLVYVKNTRLEMNSETRAAINAWPVDKIKAELNYIANTIRSSWEMVDYLFQVTGVSRAYTHQQVRTRTASYAQQAQRVVDLSKGFETLRPPTVIAIDNAAVWDDLMEKIQKVYLFYHEMGVPTQDCRGVLPTNVLTNICIKMNLRTLADLAGKRDNPRAQGEYTEVIKAMIVEATAVHSWITPFLYPERIKTPATDAIFRRLLGTGSPVENKELNDAMKEQDLLKAVWG